MNGESCEVHLERLQARLRARRGLLLPGRVCAVGGLAEATVRARGLTVLLVAIGEVEERASVRREAHALVELGARLGRLTFGEQRACLIEEARCVDLRIGVRRAGETQERDRRGQEEPLHHQFVIEDGAASAPCPRRVLPGLFGATRAAEGVGAAPVATASSAGSSTVGGSAAGAVVTAAVVVGGDGGAAATAAGVGVRPPRT